MSGPVLTGLFVLAPEWRPHLYGPEEESELGRHIRWAGPPQDAKSLRAAPELLRDVEVILAGWGTAVLDRELLAAAPRLKAVFHAGGSIRYFTTDAFWDRRIVVSSGAALNALPVAEYALATILFSLRHGWYYERGVRESGRFPPVRPMPGSFGSTVGLISLGAIGRLVVERLRPVDVRIVAYDPFVTAAEAARLGLELVGLDELFRRADVVSLHAPWLKETEGLVTGAHFAAMKPGATFINTARGLVVREMEMIAVLRARPDLWAVLDVTWPEPPEPGSPLYTLPNVVLTPHIAGTTPTEARRLGRAMVAEFHRWRTGEPLQHGITREQAAHRA